MQESHKIVNIKKHVQGKVQVAESVRFGDDLGMSIHDFPTVLMLVNWHTKPYAAKCLAKPRRRFHNYKDHCPPSRLSLPSTHTSYFASMASSVVYAVRTYLTRLPLLPTPV
jgi:hypothetical protein